MSRTRPIIFCDFDGTIVDSFETAYQLNYKYFPHLTRDQYRAWFEENPNTAITRALGSTDAFNRWAADIFSKYAKVIHTCPLFDGMGTILTKLSKTHRIIIVSSTISPIIDTYLSEHTLRTYITAILGNDIETSKVKKFQRVIAEKHADPRHCLFITDTLGDIREAAAVGIPSLAVTWGFHSAETLTKGQPFALIDTPQELIHHIEKFFAS